MVSSFVPRSEFRCGPSAIIQNRENPRVCAVSESSFVSELGARVCQSITFPMGSATPGRYYKAVCAAELRLRNENLEKVRPWWRPRNAPELENPKADPRSDVDSGAWGTSTCPVAAGRRNEDISDLYRDRPKFPDYV